MSAEAARKAPAWGAAAAEEMRKIGLALTNVGLVGAVGLPLLAGLIFYLYLAKGETLTWTLFSLPLAFIGGVIPARVWFQNQVDRRAYMWSLPVERSRGHLAIVITGWLWMMLVVSVYLAWAATLYRLTGAAGGGNVALRELFLPLPTAPANYAVYCSTATLFYLVVSVPMLLARQAAVWFPWVFLGVILPGRFLRDSDAPVVRFLSEEVLGRGRLGLTTAITGQGRLGGQASVDLWAWLPAAGLWLTVAFVAVLGASIVHRENSV